MSKHTPGPWFADGGDNYKTIYPREGRLIAEVNDRVFNYHANAHLIAAAPEMYEALEAFDKWWRLPDAERTIEAIEPVMRMCIEAKAKAEGRKE